MFIVLYVVSVCVYHCPFVCVLCCTKSAVYWLFGPWKNANQSWTCLSKSEPSGNCRVVSYFVFRDTGCICFRDVLCIIATGGFELVTCEVRFKLIYSCTYSFMSNMDDLNELKAFGEGLGLKDTALADFIKEQQAIRRDERQERVGKD